MGRGLGVRQSFIIRRLLVPAMLVDLVNVVTEDGLRLDGALRTPAVAAQPTLGVDAVLCLHGTGSNFYASNLMASLAAAIVETGAAALVVNTRGHDGISSTSAPVGRRLQGAAYEIVDACCHDITAWLGLLCERGFKRIGLLGHSLGAVKAIYSQAKRPDPAVVWVAAISPPRLSYSGFLADSRAEEFLRDYGRAHDLVRHGRPRELIEILFPLPYAISAEGFLDKYGPEERYDVLRHIDRVTCPLVVTYGTDELSTSAAFRGMPEAIAELPGSERRQLMLVDGADHFYAGMYAELWTRIERGIKRLIAT
jgi:alpha-beta hydrolase superfamily lysophospholipase